MQTRAARAGSYRFGQFTHNEEELARLKLQATLALDLEHAAWAAAGLRPGMRVLDLACGPGFTSIELARVVGPAGHVTGVDINEILLGVAQQAARAEPDLPVVFESGDAYALTAPAATFDFVYARFLFQHLRDPARVLAGIRRVLKPGGVVCILDIDDRWTCFTPARRAFDRFVRWARAGQRRKGGDRLVGAELYGLLRAAGFERATTRLYHLTSETIGLRPFLGVAVLFRLEMLGPLRKLLALPWLRAIKRAAAHPDAWGAVGLFVASAVKPAAGQPAPEHEH